MPGEEVKPTSETNHDYEPHFWATLLLLLPFGVVLDIAWRVREWRQKWIR